MLLTCSNRKSCYRGWTYGCSEEDYFHAEIRCRGFQARYPRLLRSGLTWSYMLVFGHVRLHHECRIWRSSLWLGGILEGCCVETNLLSRHLRYRMVSSLAIVEAVGWI